MFYVFGFISIIMASYGLYIIAMFFLARLSGRITEARIVGFTKNKDKMRRLPGVEYEDESLGTKRSKIKAIDNIAYLMLPSEIDGVVPILISKKDQSVRIYGYFSFVVGILCLMPFLVWILPQLFSGIMLERCAFLFVFLGVIGGVWLFLRLIRISYS